VTDGNGVGTSTAAVRSECSAHGDGRVYAIHFDADDGNGGSCSGTVNVSVPHDRRAVKFLQEHESSCKIEIFTNPLLTGMIMFQMNFIAKPWDLYPAACGVTAKHSLSINTPPLGAGSLIFRAS
jgi:hypothetical protein